MTPRQKTLSEADKWYHEMCASESAHPSPQRQAEFAKWLLEPANRSAFLTTMKISNGLVMLANMPAREARELIGPSYRPFLSVLPEDGLE